MGSPRKLRNTTEVEEFCQGFRVVEVFVGGGEGGVVQGVINVCYRPRVRLCGEERARLGPATSGTAESAASHSFLQSVQPLSGSLNLGFNSTRTSPENRTAQTCFFYHKNCRAPNFSRRWFCRCFRFLFDFAKPPNFSLPLSSILANSDWEILKHQLSISQCNLFFSRIKSDTSVNLFCDPIKQVLTDRLTLLGSGVV